MVGIKPEIAPKIMYVVASCQLLLLLLMWLLGGGLQSRCCRR